MVFAEGFARCLLSSLGLALQPDWLHNVNGPKRKHSNQHLRLILALSVDMSTAFGSGGLGGKRVPSNTGLLSAEAVMKSTGLGTFLRTGGPVV